MTIDKRQAFEQDPDQFVDIRELLLCVRKDDNGGYTILNGIDNIKDVFMVMGIVEEALQNRRDQIRMLNAQKHRANGLVVAQPSEISKIMGKGIHNG